MTKNQIKDFLHCSKNRLDKAILEASKKNVSIKLRLIDNKIPRNTDFTENETRLIFRELNATKMQQLLLEEYFDSLKHSDYYIIKGNQDFIQRWNKNHKIKCCNTCKYLKGFKCEQKQLIPYCSRFTCLTKDMDANIFRDFCSKYKYNEYNKPVLWFTDKAPTNLDKFGNPITNSQNLPKYIKKTNTPEYVGLVGFF